METKAIQRECISNIIDILKTSSRAEKENNLRKIKEELEFKITYSEDTVLRKLKRILKKIDNEIEETTSIKDELNVGNKEIQVYTIKPVGVMLRKMSSSMIRRRITSGVADLQDSLKKKKCRVTFSNSTQYSDGYFGILKM